jgi:hypothetical protein
MSLKDTVQKSVNTAFEKLKDLSVNATFDNKIVEGFDFGTGSISAEEDSYITYGFLSSKKSLVDGNPVTRTTLTIRSDPTITIDRYSEVTIDGTTYNCNIVSKDDFIVVLSLSGG